MAEMLISADIADALAIQKGINCVIGSGGKTTLLRALSRVPEGRVILTTSTKIYPFADVPLYTGEDEEALGTLLQKHRVVCTGSPLEAPAQAPGLMREAVKTGAEGKLRAPAIPFDRLARMAEYVLAEADGAKGLPLKAHAPYEPVIPEGTKRRILVVGAAGFGRTIRDVVHRPEIFCALTGASPEDTATPEVVADAIRKEALFDIIAVSQADSEPRRKEARHFASLFPGECVILPPIA